MEILFSFVGMRQVVRSEFAMGKEKRLERIAWFCIFLKWILRWEICKNCQKKENKKERTFWYVLTYVFLKILRFFF